MKDKESFVDEGQHSGNAWEWHQVLLRTPCTRASGLVGLCAHRSRRSSVSRIAGLRILVSRLAAHTAGPRLVHGRDRPRSCGQRLLKRAARKPFAWPS
jgi:hypothetical protein